MAGKHSAQLPPSYSMETAWEGQDRSEHLAVLVRMGAQQGAFGTWVSLADRVVQCGHEKIHRMELASRQGSPHRTLFDIGLYGFFLLISSMMS